MRLDVVIFGYCPMGLGFLVCNQGAEPQGSKTVFLTYIFVSAFSNQNWMKKVLKIDYLMFHTDNTKCSIWLPSPAANQVDFKAAGFNLVKYSAKV